jgi:arabinoxylan arabinofuranohydrolase
LRRKTATCIRAGCGYATALLGAMLAHAAPALADFPIASHRYLADPGALVSGGRVYLYSSNDDDNALAGGYEMKSIVCVSSSDLKNWTDHGEVLRVPADAGWASYSWAPAAIERNGTIYLYFGNNANGIGVASSTTPIGPFRASTTGSSRPTLRAALLAVAVQAPVRRVPVQPSAAWIRPV